jgi:hypothetical protein
MKTIARKSDSSQPAAETAVYLFDVRDRVREFIQAMVEVRAGCGTEAKVIIEAWRWVRIRASTISRPTSSWREELGQRPVRQRAGTLRYMGPPRPGPLRNRPVGDKCSQRGKPSQANRGPKKRGRSG